MDKLEILAHLAKDKPLFHFADEQGVRRAAIAGATLPLGDFSMAVSPGVLRWIADHLTDELKYLSEVDGGYGNDRDGRGKYDRADRRTCQAPLLLHTFAA